MIFIGIDPGVTGAVAVLRSAGAEVFDTPVAVVKNTQRDYMTAEMVAILESYKLLDEPIAVGIETTVAFPRQSSSTTAKQFRGLGLWEGIVAGLGYRYEMLRAEAWTKALGLPKGADKGAHRLFAARLFPSLSDKLSRVKDDGRADALLIAEALRRRYMGG